MTPAQEQRKPIALVLLACLLLTTFLAHFARENSASKQEDGHAAAFKMAAYDRAERANFDKAWDDITFDPCLLTNVRYTRRPISFPNDNNGFRQLAVYRVEICERAEVKREDLDPSPEK